MTRLTIAPDLAYDYSQIEDNDIRTLTKRSAEEIKPRLRRATEDIIAIGNSLATVHRYLPHGQWLPWLETEFEMSVDTARNFIRVSERFAGKNGIIPHLTPTALYALAAPSTPEDAIIEVEQHIAAGNPPTVVQTKQIIANHKPASTGKPMWATGDRFSYQSRIAAVNLVLAEQPEAAEQILNDLRNGRRGWYHELILCYTDDTDPDTWRRVASAIDAANPIIQSTNHLPPSDNSSLSPDQPAQARPVETQPTNSPSPVTGEDGRGSSLAVHFTSETDQHYTPDPVWQAAARLMGWIDLDPCSNSHSAPNIPAKRHYTAEDDGLRQFWDGFVFMNPPYGRQIGDWVAKLVEAHTSGDVPAAIALLPARTDTQWWQTIRDYPVCFVTGRLKFKGNDDNAAPFPSAIVYLGPQVQQFAATFSPFGDIWSRIK